MTPRLAIALVCVGGCGRVDFDPLADAAPPVACTSADADEPALGAFGTPHVVLTAGAGGAADDDPELSADGLELYFTSNRAGSIGDADVWRLVRTHASDPWGAPEHVAELSSPLRENTVALTRDMLTIYLASNRDTNDNNDDDIFVAHRATRAASWSTPVLIPELQAVGSNDRGPSLYRDDTRLIFHSGRMAGTPGDQIYESALLPDGVTWSTPQLLAGATGYRGWMSPCGYELYTQTTATGLMTEFFVARRTDATAAFPPATMLAELGDPGYDQDLRLTPDRHTAYFASDRSGPSLLYEAAR